MEWEKIFSNHIFNKELIPKLYKGMLQLNNKKQISQLKNGEKTWTDISPKKDIKQHLRGCTILLVIRKMQMKTTMKYHLTLSMVAIRKKKSENYKYFRVHGEIRTLTHCWWTCKLMKPLWKTVGSSSNS